MLKLIFAAICCVAATHSKSRYGRDTTSDEAGHGEHESACGAPIEGNNQNRIQNMEQRLEVLESRLIQDILQGQSHEGPGNSANPAGPVSFARPGGGPPTDNPAGTDTPAGADNTDFVSPFETILSELDVSWHTEVEDSQTRGGRQGNFGFGAYGAPCLTECDNYGYAYTWCEQAWASVGNWAYYDYCSKSPTITAYGKTCVSDCWRCSRTAYWWCYYENSSWGYCSPPVGSIQTLGTQGVPVPTFAAASVDEQPDTVDEDGVLANKDQLEIQRLEELLEYQNRLNQALEDRVSILTNGVIGEEKLTNLKTIISVSQLRSVGIDGETAPHIDSP